MPQRPGLWVVDGQQRTTAMCILFGRKPYWWPDAGEWNRTLKRYDIRFDVHTKEPPFFWVANAAIKQMKGSRYVPLSRLVVVDTEKEADQRTLMELAKTIKLEGLCDGMDAMEVYTRLDRVRKIRDKEIVTVAIDHELEDVVEIFSRLNSKGTRVTEADIYLGVVAAHNPGWVRDIFLPHLKMLAEAGFDLNPNLLFRTLTGVGAKKVRFKEIQETFWDSARVKDAWERTWNAWQRLISRFRDHGILSNEIMPTEAALVIMVSLIDRFQDQSDFDATLYWFVQASRFGRYSGSGATSLEEDLKDVQEAGSQKEALRRLLRRFEHARPIQPEDFLRDYTDSRFGRFMLYLMAYRREALDWDEHSHRIGYEGVQALASFRPQFHHIFPKKYLEGHVDDDLVNALANVAVIGPGINIRISSKTPLDYVSRYRITDEKLTQQFIDPNFANVQFAAYPSWLQERAEALSEYANALLGTLKGSL